MSLFPDRTHSYIFLTGVILLVISLPFSTFGMSIAQAIIALNFFISGNWIKLPELIKKNGIFWLIISIFIIHLIGIVFSENIPLALKDIKVKLPLLILPIIFATSSPVSRKELSLILWFFVASVALCSIYGTIRYYIQRLPDFRMISPFVSHIRLGLMVCLSLVIIIYEGYFVKQAVKIHKIILVLLVIWFLVFLFIMQSITSTLILAGVCFAWLIRWGCHNSSLKKNLILASVGLLILISLFLPVYLIFSTFQTPEKPDFKKLDKYTAQGHAYKHDTLFTDHENGNLVYIYIEESELRKEWNKRSTLNYDSLDKSGNILKYTLFRFLASKGLRKDSEGLDALSNNEIKAIESGTANTLYMKWPGLFKRIHQTAWEYFSFKESDYLADFSFIQRLVNWKAALSAFSQKPLVGWGTGDVLDAVLSQDIQKQYPRPVTNKLKPHNQYLSFAVAFGLPLTLWIVFVLIYAPFRKKILLHPLFYSFLLISLISFLGEDTLETQAGVTFFALFYNLFLFTKDHSEKGLLQY